MAEQNVKQKLSELSKSPAKSYNLHKVNGKISWLSKFLGLILRSDCLQNSIICRTNVFDRISNRKKGVEVLDSTFEFLGTLQ